MSTGLVRARGPVSGVGLGASIIQLVETTTNVVSYMNDVKNAPTRRAAFARPPSFQSFGIADQFAILDGKSKVCLGSLIVALRRLGAPAGPLEEVQANMEYLATKPELHVVAGRLGNAGKTLCWKFDRKEVEEALT